MLEHLPRWLGVLLRSVRAGHVKLTIVQEGIAPGDLTSVGKIGAAAPPASA